MTVRELISKLIKMDMDIKVVDFWQTPVVSVRLSVGENGKNVVKLIRAGNELGE